METTRTALEQLFAVRVVQWDEPTEDGSAVFAVVTRAGHVILADSLGLLIQALADRQPTLAMAA